MFFKADYFVRTVFCVLCVLTAEGVAAPAPVAGEGAAARAARLVGQLGDKSYAVRQRAQDELARLGPEADEAILAAARGDDPEVVARARLLLRLRQLPGEHEPAEVRESQESYAAAGVGLRELLIVRLGATPELKAVPALCRIVRLEPTESLSRRAAAELLYHEPLSEGGRRGYAAVVLQGLQGSRREAAGWVLAALRLRADRRRGIEECGEALERCGVDLKSRGDEATRFAAAVLGCFLAEAHAAAGAADKAEAAFAAAAALLEDDAGVRTQSRLRLGFLLQRRGHAARAEKAYRSVLEAKDATLAADAGEALSELLHDAGKDLAAAEARQQACQRVVPGAATAIDDLRSSRARAQYFYACHFGRQGNRDKQIECLRKALTESPLEVDTLIAAYKLADPPAGFHKRAEEAVAAALERIRRQIEEPDEDSPFSASDAKMSERRNAFAWLAANTGRELDDALRYIHEALEMRPATPAYLDTLAHVCFARGDWDSAVAHQARAAELEPHSRQITAALAEFRKAAAEAKARPSRGATPPQ